MTRLDRILAGEGAGVDDTDLLIDIARITKRVRELQKEFFKSRSRDTLAESKRAERDLDRLIAQEDGGLFS